MTRFSRPRRTAIAAAAAAALLFSSCGEGQGGDGEAGAGDDDGPIILGAVLAKTGALAPFDLPPYQGLQLAVEDINAKGGIDGRQVELIDFDIKDDFASGAVGAQQVIQKGADAVVVACDFDRGAAAAFTAVKQGKLTLSLCAASPKFGSQVISPLAFTMSTGTPATGSILAEWAFNEKKLERPYVWTDNSIEFDKDLCYYFEERWKQLAGDDSIAGADTFQNDDTNVSSQISRIRDAEPGFVVLCSYSPGGPSALRQLRAAGVDVPVLSGEAMDGTYWLDAVPNLSDFYYVTYGSIMGDNSEEEVNTFYERFAEKVGDKPLTSHPIVGYALLEAYAHAVEEAGTTDSETLVEELETFEDVPTIVGDTTFTADLHMDVQRPMTMMQVQDGKLSFLERYSAEETPTIRFD